MPSSSRDIKRRIASVKNTRQITKAMEMVSAAKMRRTQEAALRARPYAFKALELLSRLTAAEYETKHPLLKKRDIRRELTVILSTDKGLCGGLNANVFKKVKANIDQYGERERVFVTVGKKAKEFAEREALNILASFPGFGDRVDIVDTLALSRFLMDGYLDKAFDKVVVAYTNFLSTIEQKPAIRPILPLEQTVLKRVIDEVVPKKGKYSDAPLATIETQGEYLFEPTVTEVLRTLLPKLIETQIYHTVLESNASEHSARMVAMKNASESAGEMMDALTLSYNKARQAAITQEISEISAGRAALES